MLNLEKYAGQTVDIIYIDRYERITQRCVIVRQVRGSVIEVFCLQRHQPRRFRVDRILSVRRATGRQIG
jgi:predicted DNA-binding transcriptional regulator YafY